MVQIHRLLCMTLSKRDDLQTCQLSSCCRGAAMLSAIDGDVSFLSVIEDAYVRLEVRELTV